jgi:hypothetical protein
MISIIPCVDARAGLQVVSGRRNKCIVEMKGKNPSPQASSFSGTAIRIEAPTIFVFLVAEDVNVVIIRPDFEALVPHTIPLIQNFLDFIGCARLSRKGKAPRTFVRPVA